MAGRNFFHSQIQPQMEGKNFQSVTMLQIQVSVIQPASEIFTNYFYNNCGGDTSP